MKACPISKHLPERMVDLLAKSPVLSIIEDGVMNILSKSFRELKDYAIDTRKFKIRQYWAGIIDKWAKALNDVKDLEEFIAKLDKWEKAFLDILYQSLYSYYKVISYWKNDGKLVKEWAQDQAKRTMLDILKTVDVSAIPDKFGVHHLLLSLENANLYWVFRTLFGNEDYKGILSNLIWMFSTPNHLVYKKLLEKLTEEEIKQLYLHWFKFENEYRWVWWWIKRFLLEAKSLTRFTAYTLFAPNWLAMALVQWLTYDNLLHSFGKEELEEAGKFLDEFNILPSELIREELEVFADIAAVWAEWSFIQKIYNKVADLLKLKWRARQYLIATQWWLHNVIDLFYVEKLRRAALIRAMKQLGIQDFNELRKFIQTPEGLEIIKRMVKRYYEDMRGFPVLWWLSKYTSGKWRWFMYLFGFMSTWGINVMKTFLEDAFLPIWSAIDVYKRTWSVKTALQALRASFYDEAFLFAWMNIAHSVLWAHRLDYALRTNEDWEENPVEYFLKLGSWFNMTLQAFESNILWRIWLDIYEGLTFKFPNWEEHPIGFAAYKTIWELTRWFLRELKIVNPFVEAATAYAKFKSAWYSDEEAFSKAQDILFNWFKRAFTWYIRYLEGSIFDDETFGYYIPHSSKDIASFLIWDNVNKFIDKYWEIKDYEWFLKWLDKGWIRNVGMYFLYNLPIIKWVTRGLGAEYFSEVKDFMSKIEDDVVLKKIRTEWVVPVDLPGVSPAIQEKWINYLYKEMTKWAPQWLLEKGASEKQIWMPDEIKRNFEKIKSSLTYTQEDIWVAKMIDALSSEDYWKLLELYHSFDWQPNEAYMKGLVQILGMLEANSPWSTRKFLWWYTYALASARAKELFGTTSWRKLTPEQRLLIERDVLKMVVPLMSFSSKDLGYIDYTFLTNAAQKYMEMMYGDILKETNGKLTNDIKRFIAVDILASNLMWKRGQWDAYKMKNIFVKIGKSIKDEGKRMVLIDKVLSDLTLMKWMDEPTKLAMKTWVLMANMDLWDNILKNPEYKAKYWKLIDNLVNHLWQARKEINDMWKKMIVMDLASWWKLGTWQAGTLGWKMLKNYYSSYQRYKPLYDSFRKYAKRLPLIEYMRENHWSYGRYYPVYWWTASWYRPTIARYLPYFSRGYYKARPNTALSKRLIKEITKQPVKRSFKYYYWRVRPPRTKNR